MAEWAIFSLAIICILIFIYSISILLLRSFDVSWLASIAISPILSVTFYSTLAIIYSFLSIYTNLFTLFVSFLIISILFLIIKKPTLRSIFSLKEESTVLKYLPFYILFGLVLFIVLFLIPTGSPSSFGQNYDDVTHYALIRNFLRTGNYSSLTASIYTDFGDQGQYYPAGVHVVIAAVTGLLNTSPMIVYNAFLLVVIVFVWSSGMLLLIDTLFGKSKRIYIIGVFVGFAMISFPWAFLLYGRLTPTLFSFSLLPAGISCFIKMIKSDWKSSEQIKYFIIILLFAIGAVFTQPSYDFAMIIILAPFCIQTILQKPNLCGKNNMSSKHRILLSCGFVLFCLIVWTVAFFSPFFAPTVTHNWGYSDTVVQAITRLAKNIMCFDPSIWFCIPFVFTILGIVQLFRKKENQWLAFSYFILAFSFTWSLVREGRIKHFLTGFFYTDQNRVIALIAIVSIPLMIYGLSLLVDMIVRLFKRGTRNSISINKLSNLSSGFLVIILTFSTLLPIKMTNSNGNSAFNTAFEFQDTATRTYKRQTLDDSCALSVTKLDFLDKVKVITKDEIVANNPLDGSLFSYQYNSIRAMHRHSTHSYKAGTTDQCFFENEKDIDANLDKISQDQNLQNEVQETGIRYVLKLNDTYNHLSPWWITGEAEKSLSQYKGIISITDDTPGFKKVLEDGEMRLYEIQY